VDATLGGAGHSKLIAQKLGKKGTLIGIDADAAAIERGFEALATAACRTVLIRGNFRDMHTLLAGEGIAVIDKAVFDLGWSGFQLADGRGFSFLGDEPLLMTYEQSPDENVLTARTIVNTWEEESLADVIFGWGEERYARRIARRIVETRVKHPFATARELAECIRAAVPAPYRHGRTHPATKTFQALRIAVNDEMGALTAGLDAAWALLSQHGRIAVISFHSIEDRIVKHWMHDRVTDGTGTLLAKKPIIPTKEEIRENPRARSAKLRVIEKI
jgi:16S rRNA (cytosine1402-N4)-methyltransferase